MKCFSNDVQWSGAFGLPPYRYRAGDALDQCAVPRSAVHEWATDILFNAHPALYLGKQSNFDRPVLSMTANKLDGRLEGKTTILGHQFTTTGLLGASEYLGAPTPRRVEATLFPLSVVECFETVCGVM